MTTTETPPTGQNDDRATEQPTPTPITRTIIDDQGQTRTEINPDAVATTIADLAHKAAAQELTNRGILTQLETISTALRNVRKPPRKHSITGRRALDFTGEDFQTPINTTRATSNLPPPPPFTGGPIPPRPDIQTGQENQGPHTNTRTTTEQEGPRRTGPETHDDEEETDEDEAERLALRAELAEMRAMLAKTQDSYRAMQTQVHQATSKAPVIDRMLEEARRTPFKPEITAISLPDPGKIKIPVFQGLTDPKAHLAAFHVAMNRAKFPPGQRDAGLCLLFAEHLEGPALDWFLNLDKHSVGNFHTLETEFLSNYAVMSGSGPTGRDLWSIRQGEKEPLRDFINRFKQILTQVRGMGDEASIEALKQALWFTSEFRRTLARNPVSTIQEALQRSLGYMADEEEMLSIQARLGRVAGKPPTTSSQQPNRTKTATGRYVNHEGPAAEGAHSYMVDDAEEEDECYYLEEGAGLETSQGRGRGRSSAGRGRGRGRSNQWLRQNTYDETAFCDLHGNKGHSTANCKVLGAALAKSLAEGKLGNFKVSDFKDAVQTKTTLPEQAPDDQPKRDRTEADDAPRNPRPRIN